MAEYSNSDQFRDSGAIRGSECLFIQPSTRLRVLEFLMSLRIFFFLKGAIMRRPLFLVCICMIPIACSSPTAPTKSIQITTVSWFYENNPPDRNNGHLNMGITVYYSGSSIQTNDLCSLVITTRVCIGNYWRDQMGSP